LAAELEALRQIFQLLNPIRVKVGIDGLKSPAL